MKVSVITTGDKVYKYYDAAFHKHLTAHLLGGTYEHGIDSEILIS